MATLDTRRALDQSPPRIIRGEHLGTDLDNGTSASMAAPTLAPAAVVCVACTCSFNPRLTMLSRLGQERLTAANTIYQLLEMYFASFYRISWQCFLHKQSIVGAYEVGLIPSKLLQSICAVTVMLQTPDSPLAREWMEQVTRDLYPTMIKPSTEDIASWLHVIFYEYSSKRKTPTWMLVGIVCR